MSQDLDVTPFLFVMENMLNILPIKYVYPGIVLKFENKLDRLIHVVTYLIQYQIHT